jgi:hypothetical protein
LIDGVAFIFGDSGAVEFPRFRRSGDLLRRRRDCRQ